MDISYFMTWFLSQVVSIFSQTFNIMDNIQFMGTSLLKVLLTIMILVPLITVVLTIGQSGSVLAERSEQVRSSESYKTRKLSKAFKKSVRRTKLSKS